MNMALEALHVMHGVRQHHDAALREHDIVVEILAQPFPQFHRMFVKMRAFIVEIVGADDGGVAPGIAAAEPALFDHRDVGDAVLLGQIIGSTQAMTARADDDDIILSLGFGIGPLLLPALVAGKCIFDNRSGRKSGHGQQPVQASKHLALFLLSRRVFRQQACVKRRHKYDIPPFRDMRGRTKSPLLPAFCQEGWHQWFPFPGSAIV